MALQPLPNEFEEAVRIACRDQMVDEDEAIEALSQTVIGDLLDYNIWSGPGPNTPLLAVDVYVITSEGLFSYEAHSSGITASGVTFLDTISEIIILKINEETAKYALAISKYELGEMTRIFSNDEGIQALRAFYRTLAQARESRVRSQPG